ncbi:MAG: HEPN domain-containing protein [Prevotella sp.]|nr:HEPN domain-containing protein [Prevotella sp.]
MKEELDEQSRSALVAYRIQRADETMIEVEAMADIAHYNAAFNRMYYACYYATVALLLKHKISASTHSGVKTMLSLHFVSTGKLSTDDGKLFISLFETRHSGDYDDFVYCDRELYDEYLPKARKFIEDIKDLIKQD